MIETIALTEQQMQILEARNSDWLPMTPEQHDLVRTCGADRSCAFVGDEFVRMPKDHFERMLEAAFKAASHSAIGMLGITDQTLIEKFDVLKYDFGDRHLSVTVTLFDGRSATASGQLIVPGVAH